MESAKRYKSNNVKEEYSFLLTKSLVYSLLGIIIFFIPIKLNGQFLTIIYHLSYKLQNDMKGLLQICILFYISIGIIMDIIKNDKVDFKKKSLFKVLSLIILFNIFYGGKNTFFVDENIIFIIEEVILGIVTVFPISILFMPLLDYGLIDVSQRCFSKYSENLFNLSGKSVINILIYIFTNPFCGIFMTNKLYKEGRLTEKEACNIILNFSLLSYPIIDYICRYTNISKIYIFTISITILLFINIILARIYPICDKSALYFDKKTKKKNKNKKTKTNTDIDNNKMYILKQSVNNLEKCINIIMNTLPQIIICLYLTSIVLNSKIIADIINYLLSSVFDFLKIANINEIIRFIIDLFFNSVVAIENINTDIRLNSRVLICIIGVLSSTSFTTNMVYILNTKDTVNINVREFLLSYILKITLIIIVYTFINYLYNGHAI